MNSTHLWFSTTFDFNRYFRYYNILHNLFRTWHNCIRFNTRLCFRCTCCTFLIFNCRWSNMNSTNLWFSTTFDFNRYNIRYYRYYNILHNLFRTWHNCIRFNIRLCFRCDIMRYTNTISRFHLIHYCKFHDF